MLHSGPRLLRQKYPHQCRISIPKQSRAFESLSGAIDVVFSDSQQVLQAIQAGNSANTGRVLLGRIAEGIDALSKTGIDVHFRWSPGHKGVVGNEEANDAAREVLSQEGRLTALARERVREVEGVI
jgi:ribonuclease HI